MAFDIIWTKRAENDLSALYDYTAKTDKPEADCVVNWIITAVGNLSQCSENTGYVPELFRQNLAIYREALVSVWRVVVYIRSNKVYIICIIDGRCNVGDILFRRLIQ
jgi:toxin ParE1/3/4